LDGVERGDVDDAAGGAGEGDCVDSAEFDGDASPGQAGSSFGDAEQQQREPAE
jgi:hypothetical protein